MKRYKLLKDLPFAKAGEIFDDQYEDGILTFYHQNRTIDIYKTDIENFEEWFEEVRAFGEYYYVIDVGHVGYLEDGSYRPNDTLGRVKIGNIFETREKAEEYLAYLKAKEIIKQDTKGFKPNWRDKDEDRFMGCWDFKRKRALFDYGDAFKTPEIYFKSREDISESFKKHPDEWKTYLTYEQ